MRRLRLWLALYALGALALTAGCSAPAAPVETPALAIVDAAASEPEAPRMRELSPAARAKCVAEGGFVQRAGMLGSEGCYRRFKDGGKTCSDGAECLAGRCDYKGKGKDGGAQSGLRGQCPRDSVPFGCRQSLTAGRVAVAICVD